jgi:hypothetical protein
MSSSAAASSPYAWTEDKQATAMATSLRNMRRTVANMLHDDSELREISAQPLTGLEIDQLYQYLKNEKVALDLVDAIENVQGDLDTMIRTIHEKRHPGEPLTAYDRNYTVCSFFPIDVNPKTLIPFTHLDFFSDSTANFPKSRAGHFGWEYYMNRHFGDDHRFIGFGKFVMISATL